jgi:hypothetical protein
MAILASLWIFISSNITYYMKFIVKNNELKGHPWIFSLLAGFLLEIFLSIMSILIKGILLEITMKFGTGIFSGLDYGVSYAALISPLSSFLGAAIGVKSRKPPWKFFRL